MTEREGIIIEIDNMLPFISCPHYCRDDSDKIRWLALKWGMVKTIRLADKVTFIPERNCYRMEVL